MTKTITNAIAKLSPVEINDSLGQIAKLHAGQDVKKPTAFVKTLADSTKSELVTISEALAARYDEAQAEIAANFKSGDTIEFEVSGEKIVAEIIAHSDRWLYAMEGGFSETAEYEWHVRPDAVAKV